MSIPGFTETVVRFDEVTGEQGDVDELNYLITFEGDVYTTPLDINGPFKALDLTAELGMVGLSPTAEGEDLDLQQSTATPGKYQAVVPKELFPGITVPGDAPALTTGTGLLIPVVPVPPQP